MRLPPVEGRCRWEGFSWGAQTDGELDERPWLHFVRRWRVVGSSNWMIYLVQGRWVAGSMGEGMLRAGE